MRFKYLWLCLFILAICLFMGCGQKQVNTADARKYVFEEKRYFPTEKGRYERSIIYEPGSDICTFTKGYEKEKQTWDIKLSENDIKTIEQMISDANSDYNTYEGWVLDNNTHKIALSKKQTEFIEKLFFSNGL